MSVREARIERLPSLPETFEPEARVYLRPCRIVAGDEAQALLAAGEALRLAGGPLAFAALEVLLRTPGLVRSAFVSPAAVRCWAQGLRASARDHVALLIERLTAPRSGLDRPRIMGVVNVTPDSFSDGGEHLEVEAAVAFARRLVQDGADILDIGGESTRPFADPVPPEVEIGRVLPVVERLRGAGVDLSIDTRSASVMEAALSSGASMINDVSALTYNPRSLEVAAASDARIVLMHMQGEPATMQLAPAYEHAALDVYDALEARIEACVAAGIARERLIVDPGLCFGKHEPHNLLILQSFALYHGLGCPILLGASRKGNTEAIERGWAPKARLPSSLAAALYGLDRGVQVLRVHDVDATRQALLAWQALTAA